MPGPDLGDRGRHVRSLSCLTQGKKEPIEREGRQQYRSCSYVRSAPGGERGTLFACQVYRHRVALKPAVQPSSCRTGSRQGAAKSAGGWRAARSSSKMVCSTRRAPAARG